MFSCSSNFISNARCVPNRIYINMLHAKAVLTFETSDILALGIQNLFQVEVFVVVDV